MKKLFTGFTIALVAGAVQAGTIVWGTGALGTDPYVTSESAKIANLTGSILVLSYTGTLAFETDAGTVTGMSASGGAIGTVWVNGVTFGTGVAMAANKDGRFSGQFEDATLNVGSKYAIIVFETTGITGTTGWDVTDGKYDMYTYISNSATGYTLGGFSASGTELGFEAVPEPTSFALLGLGAAALALRRRIRKA